MNIIKLNSSPEGWSQLRSILLVSGAVGVDIETTGHEGKGQEGALEAHRGRISLVATPPLHRGQSLALDF
jgi:hypothetical protein